MHIVVVGINHHSAPVELRERLAFSQDSVPGALAQIRQELGLEEAAILSTCNRVEIYGRVAALDGAVARLQGYLSRRGGLPPDALAAQLYSLSEPHSVQHLFAVASGLDSMVLGEDEIQGQMKQAYELARGCGATGKVFNALFQRAFNTAKAVRTQTGICRGATSVGSVAVELAEKIFGRLAQARVLLIGAGEIGQATMQRLAERGVRNLKVTNRSFERAAGLALAYGASAVPLEQLDLHVVDSDIVIASTSAPGAILTRESVGQAMRSRHQRPLCVVDLGVPRNVEASVSGLENVYLFNIDDLRLLAEHHHREREQAIEHSREIINDKAERFLAWWQQEGRSGCVPSQSAPGAAP